MAQNILRDDIEYVVHCDSKGVIIGPLSKAHAHMEGVVTSLTHYSTWSMIYNQKIKKYGIQLKNPKKHYKFSAGKWDMGVAGHNCYVNENNSFRPLDFDETLANEAKEEIGIDLKMFKTKNAFLKNIKEKPKQISGFIFEQFHYKTEKNNEWVGLGFIVCQDIDVKFTDDEVIDFKWLTPEELKDFSLKNENCLSTIPLVLEKVEKFRKENSI